MAEKSFFYSSIDSVLEEFANEKLLSTYSNVDFVDKSAQIRVNNLYAKITTHKIICSSNPNLEKATSQDTQFVNFIIKISHIKTVEKKFAGVFSKTLDHYHIHTNHGIVTLYSKHLEGITVQIEGAIQKQEWKQEILKQQVTPSVYLGLKQQLQEQKKEVQNTQQTVVSSFQGDFTALFKNAEELKKTSTYIKNNLQTEQSDDVGKILQDIGCFQIITKDEVGDKYYSEIAKQLYKLASELFPKMGGLISMLDLYYYFNKKRTMSLVSPDEVLKACSQFRQLNLNAKIAIYDGIKVIESTQYDYETDFNNTIGKYISCDKGYSAEQLSRKLGYSLMITRIKLKNACRIGKLCIDNRIEGAKYYKNIFLELKI